MTLVAPWLWVYATFLGRVLGASACRAVDRSAPRGSAPGA